MALITELVKIGTCSTADFESGTVTVSFPDQEDKVSPPLPVIYQGGPGATNGLPKPGDMVLCLMQGNGKGNGFCLGVMPDSIPGTAGNQGVYFPDGSYVFYDSAAQQIVVKAAGGVRIEGDVTINGRLKADNIE